MLLCAACGDGLNEARPSTEEVELFGHSAAFASEATDSECTGHACVFFMGTGSEKDEEEEVEEEAEENAAAQLENWNTTPSTAADTIRGGEEKAVMASQATDAPVTGKLENEEDEDEEVTGEQMFEET